MQDVFIYDHVRTPRGKGRAGGALNAITPVRLAAQVLAALRERNRINPAGIDEVGLGVVMPIGEQGADIARVALLEAGYGDTVGGFQLNRFCTSGLDTVKLGFGLIASGQAQAAIGGGVESMSRVPIGSDGGAVYTDPCVGMRYPYIPNGVAADLMAALDGVNREQIDAYAVESQRRAHQAVSSGRFDASLVPVRDRLGEVVLSRDEAHRPGTTMEDLARLPPAFEKPGAAGYDQIVLRRYPQLERIAHIHTGGNSSGIVDGACAVLLGNAGYGARNGLKRRARIRAAASCADEPLLSLGGPVPVTEKLLGLAGMDISDIDLFEVNEAFAVVPMRYSARFDIDPQNINPNGGAIALGHPIGATGAMLLGTLLDELERRDLNTGLVTLCAAAGQSTAMIIERV